MCSHGNIHPPPQAKLTRSKLMKTMAQQRLKVSGHFKLRNSFQYYSLVLWHYGEQSEVASLAAARAKTSAVFTPYIIPDAHALCMGLHLIKKMIKSEKFLFVIPMAGVCVCVCVCVCSEGFVDMLLLYIQWLSALIRWRKGERTIQQERQ